MSEKRTHTSGESRKHSSLLCAYTDEPRMISRNLARNWGRTRLHQFAVGTLPLRIRRTLPLLSFNSENRKSRAYGGTDLQWWRRGGSRRGFGCSWPRKEVGNMGLLGFLQISAACVLGRNLAKSHLITYCQTSATILKDITPHFDLTNYMRKCGTLKFLISMRRIWEKAQL